MKLHTFLLVSLAAFNVQAEVTERHANKDNTLFESTAQPLSNGAGDYFFVGRTLQGTSDRRRGLLYFDLSSFPTGTTINDVTLQITSTRTIAGPSNITIHAALTEWGEGASDAGGQEGGGTTAEPGDATWTDAFFGGDEWDNVGGDFDPTALASSPINGLETISFFSNDFTALVQLWVDDSATNLGLVLLGDESTAPTAFQFASRENQVNSSPKLIIDYTLPAVVTQLNPAKDNTLYETVDGSTSNGAGDRIFIGKIQGGATRRAVMEFDVSSIPAAATIDNVTLDLTVTNIPGSAQSADANLHFVTNEWGAAGSSGSGNGAPSQSGDATWIHTFFDTDTWTNAGGDFLGSPSAITSYSDVDNTIAFATSNGLVADVTTWVQNPSENHGWIMLGDETNNGNARGMGSADNSDANSRPMLTVEYSVSDLIFADDIE